MNQLETRPISKIHGEYIPPGDKSISHRLAMLGALAEGTSYFSHFLFSDDCLRTIEAFQAMGVKFDMERLNEKKGGEIQSGNLNVEGIGLRGLSKPKSDLDLGNSGTSMRLLLGILAGQPFEVRLTGDRSLCKRPMRRVTEPLRQMGAKIKGREDGNFAPLEIKGGSLKGINWRNDIASAQVKSAILFAGLYAEGETIVGEIVSSRDHTERLLTLFGAPFRKVDRAVSVRKAERLKSVSFHVPGDFSSAAFFIAATLLIPNSELVVRQVGLNPSRIGFAQVLQSMGADLKFEVTQDQEEPIGNIYVKPSHLKGTTIGKDLIPSLIDELPILMVVCALAEGASVIQGAQELRVKETDRIKSMATGLSAIGAKVSEREDGCFIEGVRELQGGIVSSFGDHRTAMSFLIAGLCSKRGIIVRDTDCIQTSYPGFEADLRSICEF